MGLSSALYSGVSGMAATSNAMNVVGNNIANSNTVGYKASRTVFADLLSNQVSSSGGMTQVGTGVGMASVDSIFSQGTFENTESNTDLAIEGAGFFILADGTTGTSVYSRDGSFHFDEIGQLVNTEGFNVQGYYLDENNDPTGDLTNIQVDTDSYSPANATSGVTLTTNLDAQSVALPGGAAFDIDNPDDTSNYAASLQVYDSQGGTHLMTNYFRKTAANAWEYHTVVSGADVGDPADFVEVASGTLSFDVNGRLVQLDGNDVYMADGVTPVDPEPVATTAGMTWVNGSDPTLPIEFAFNMTQYSSNSVVVSQVQDGFGTGNLVQLSIDEEGNIIGNYSSGEPRQLARIALAKFTNPGGLWQEGGNIFSATNASGVPIVGTVGSGVGSLYTNSLEQSNVDLAKEFVSMITIQRAYQANSRIITTTDEMMNEMINLKR
ncbi:MAG: flagellar hook protein FlgE [Deltaproteobacteria bacterium]|nr:flagellar hook protein FlgE [Deltaproteobacteria bacterium]